MVSGSSDSYGITARYVSRPRILLGFVSIGG